MGLAEQFAAVQPPRRNIVERILEELSGDDRAALEAALADPSLSHIAIARVLTANGYQVGRTAVGDYRRTRGDS